MLSLTIGERRVALFLISVALIGLGINFAIKAKPSIEKVVKVDDHIVKIDINQASLEDLSCMQNITPALAKKIIEYRQAHSQFRKLDELKEIKGIGEYRYQKLKDLFFVE